MAISAEDIYDIANREEEDFAKEDPRGLAKGYVAEVCGSSGGLGRLGSRRARGARRGAIHD